MKKLSKSQSGLVSIMITLVMMIVISLVVIGFARITRREQRQSLDQQLSTQAFYAAESGVNDAINKIKAGVPADDDYLTDCNAFMSSQSLTAASNLDGTGNIQYTCLLVDQAPKTLLYDSITEKSTIVPMTAKGSNNINSITVQWKDKGATTTNVGGCTSTPPTTNVFPVSGSWPANCDAGVIRIDLVPASGSNLSRSGLASGARTYFLYPKNGGTNNTSDNIIGVACSGASGYTCSYTIPSLNSKSYALRIRSIYKESSMQITASDGANDLGISGTQAVIDSTGKAGDVIRRISVRVKTTPFGDAPDYAIQSRFDICKRLGIIPNRAPIEDSACDSI